MPETAVTRQLDLLGIPYRLFQHAGPVESLEQAARERGQRPEQVVRSILFRLPDESYVMVLVAGPGQISWPALRSYLGQRRLTLATPDEVLRVTGYQIGSVSPFGLPAPMRILLDRSVLGEAEISLGSGQRGLGVILKSADLQRALPASEVAQFSA